jgi:tetratricopeptide (TPR) repeat protein
MRAALDRLEARGQHDRLTRLTVALAEYWPLRGLLAEGERRLATAVAAYTDPTALRARTLIAYGGSVNDPELERRLAEEAIGICERIGDERGLAHARYALANALAMGRRWAEARDLMEESVRAFERLDEPFEMLRARRGLAWAYEELGDITRYRELTEQNLVHARRLGMMRIVARSVGALAMVAVDEGRVADAREMLVESYGIDHALGNRMFVSVDLARFAAMCAAEGRDEIAARLLGCSRALREEIGWTPESWAAQEFDATLALVSARLAPVELASALEAGAATSPDDAVALALGRPKAPLGGASGGTPPR